MIKIFNIQKCTGEKYHKAFSEFKRSESNNDKYLMG